MSVLVHADAADKGGRKPRLLAELHKTLQVLNIEAAAVPALQPDLMRKCRVPLIAEAQLVVDEELLLVRHVGDKPRDLQVEPRNFLVSAEQLEVLVHCEAAPRLGPRLLSYILPPLAQQIKVCQERVVDDLVPGEWCSGRRQGGGGSIIRVECALDALRAGLQGFGNMLA